MELLLSVVGFLLLSGVVWSGDTSFNKNYKISYGVSDHVVFSNQGTQLQISLDNSSGSGFESKTSYGSGYFSIKLKHPGEKYTAGVVTAFYLTSNGNFSSHNELDFEFLGNITGEPVSLQTNVYVDGFGAREQRTYLWFDPAADFHDYAILWNHHQIVWYVDGTPIRVLKNSRNGAIYPIGRAMQIRASIWDGSSWQIHKINYTYAPFKASFKGFDVNGCSLPHNSTEVYPCSSENLWWNTEKYWNLDADQQRAYEHVKKTYLIYDYCTDKPRYPQSPPECIE